MGIARSQMRRQLYGIGNLVGREEFGLGSSLKKFVRKIIPNEVSKAATTLAPFVAPFDPATAAVMASVGSFDQTGRIGSSLKSGALTYGGGQLARYIGGAGFQALPGTSGFAGQSLLSPQAYSGGIMSALDPRTGVGLTKPTGTQTGLGKFLSGKGTPQVTGVGEDEAARKAISEQLAQASRDAAKGFEDGFFGDGGIDVYGDVYAPEVTQSEIIKNIGATGNIKNILQGQDIGANAFELLKKGGEAIFYTTDAKGNRVLDKKAVFAAIAGANSYLEAQQALKDAGLENEIELSKQEWEEAKAKKRTQYDSYLSTFFTDRTTKAYGGRIGYGDGTKPSAEENTPSQEIINRMIAQIKDMSKRGADIETIKSVVGASDQMIKEALGKAKGGRIGYNEGTKPAIPPEDFKKIIEEFIKNQEKQEKIKRENKAYGGRMKYSEAGIVSLTDEDSGVMYSDPSGKPLSKQEAMKAFNQMAIQEGLEKNKMMPKEKPQRIKTKGRLKGIMQLAGAMEPEQGKEYFESTVLDMMETSGMKAQDINALMDEIQKEVLNEETRITKANGSNPAEMGMPTPPSGAMVPTPEQMEKMKREIFSVTNNADILLKDDPIEVAQEYQELQQSGRMQAAQGGRMHYALGDGVASIPIRDNGMGVQELDYRGTGGMVPVGVKEKADDVPAMLSKNEFVITADAVRGIGNGSIENGSEKLYNMMKQYEQVGKLV